MSIASSSRGRLWFRFVTGMSWLAMIAAGLAALSGYPFIFMYAATVAAALLCAGLALAWMYCWATNERAKERQFGIGSLLFLTTFAAIYFAGIRWVIVQIEAQVGQHLPWGGIAGVGIAYTLLILTAFPAVFGVTESLMWFFVWLVRWPPARPVWRMLLRRQQFPLKLGSLWRMRRHGTTGKRLKARRTWGNYRTRPFVSNVGRFDLIRERHPRPNPLFTAILARAGIAAAASEPSRSRSSWVATKLMVLSGRVVGCDENGLRRSHYAQAQPAR